MLGIVALVLLASPKGERPPKPPYVSGTTGHERTCRVCQPVALAAQQLEPQGCAHKAVYLPLRRARAYPHLAVYLTRGGHTRSTPCFLHRASFCTSPNPRPHYALPCPQGYDRTIVGMVVIMAALCLGVLGAAVGLLVFHVLPPTYNRPLSYHLDIMQRRD